MGRAPHNGVILAMELIRGGMKPREAAELVGIALTTVYKSVLYKEWKNAQPRS